MKVWEWLNGRKTVAGAGMLFASMVIRQVIIGKWHVDPLAVPWLVPLEETLDWFGGGLAGFGFVHKGFKLMAPAQAPPPKGEG